jgi:hypothetical protein
MYLWGKQSPALLGFFRPNQAFDRGIYGMGCASCSLGDDDSGTDAITGASPVSLDPTTLIAGVGLLFLGSFLLGGRTVPKIRKGRAKRLRKRRAALSKQISSLETF